MIFYLIKVAMSREHKNIRKIKHSSIDIDIRDDFIKRTVQNHICSMIHHKILIIVRSIIKKGLC